MLSVGSRGIRRRKPVRRLPRLSRRLSGNVIDEPPIAWSPGFDANPNSPAGELQGFWRLTGRGSDIDEEEAKRKQRRVTRLGAFVLRLLGYRPRMRGGSTGQR